jgi:hypothetical protein
MICVNALFFYSSLGHNVNNYDDKKKEKGLGEGRVHYDRSS